MKFTPSIITSMSMALHEQKTAIEEIKERYASAHREFIDYYHIIEESEITEENGYKYAKEFQEIMIKRRHIKGELVISEKVYESALDSFDKMQKVYKSAVIVHKNACKPKSK